MKKTSKSKRIARAAALLGRVAARRARSKLTKQQLVDKYLAMNPDTKFGLKRRMELATEYRERFGDSIASGIDAYFGRRDEGSLKHYSVAALMKMLRTAVRRGDEALAEKIGRELDKRGSGFKRSGDKSKKRYPGKKAFRENLAKRRANSWPNKKRSAAKWRKTKLTATQQRVFDKKLRILWRENANKRGKARKSQRQLLVIAYAYARKTKR